MSRLQSTIDKDLKENAEMILSKIGLTPTVAITMFYTEIVKQKTLPFHPSKVEKIPNETTLQSFKEAERGEVEGPFKTIDELFESLNS